MRRFLPASLLALLAAPPALAADGAALRVIGYSPDSRYFAFEQYGYEGASGAPWWEIAVVDLEADRLVDGSPFRARIDEADDTPPLSMAQARAMDAADRALKDRNITEPAEILAANPATEVLADRSRMVFDREYVAMGSAPSGPSEIRHELRIESRPLPRPGACDPDSGDTYGFVLTIRDLKLGSRRVLHADSSIPASRGCPMGYDLSAVVAPAGFTDTDRLVAIVGVYRQGWEGADQTFIAVPFVLSD